MKGFQISALAGIFGALLVSQALAVPLTFNVQGRLTDSNGVNRDGQFTITFRIFDDVTPGAPDNLSWVEILNNVNVTNGNFQVLLGLAPDPSSPNSDLNAVFDGNPRFLEFQVSGEAAMIPRTSLVSVPYAIRAQTADALTTPAFPPNAIQDSKTEVFQNSVRVRATFISVEGIAFKNVDLSKSITPAANSWHSVNLVTDGSSLDICVVDDFLSSATLSSCGAGLTAFRRVGWANANTAVTSSGFAFSTQLGDWWYYESDVLLPNPPLNLQFLTTDASAVIPPTSNLIDANLFAIRTGGAAGIFYNSRPTPEAGKPTSETTLLIHSNAASSTVVFDSASAPVRTNSLRQVDLRASGFSSGFFRVKAYYDPI